MRNHIAIARRSDRIFAIQLCARFNRLMGRRSGDEDVCDLVSELLFGEVALESAVLADGNAAGFLADNDGDGVGALGEADGGAVAQSG